MRKVIFTEEQIKKIVGEDVADYLNNIDNAGEVPDNAYGTEVFVNNVDKDSEDNVTTTDRVARHKNRSNSGGRLFARSRTFESVNESSFDDTRTRNFGKNAKENILNGAGEGAGKMLNNLANDINNGGTRNNTNQVRLSRLRKQAKEDPITFMKNGGKQTLKALEDSVEKEQSKQSTMSPSLDNTVANTPDAMKGTGTGHHSDKEAIYYY